MGNCLYIICWIFPRGKPLCVRHFKGEWSSSKYEVQVLEFLKICLWWLKTQWNIRAAQVSPLSSLPIVEKALWESREWNRNLLKNCNNHNNMNKRAWKRETILPTKRHLPLNKQKCILKAVPGMAFPKCKNEDWALLKACHDVIKLNSARNCTRNPCLSNNDVRWPQTSLCSVKYFLRIHTALVYRRKVDKASFAGSLQ